MEEDIKKRIRMMTGNKGDRILFDLDSGNHYVMDSKEEDLSENEPIKKSQKISKDEELLIVVIGVIIFVIFLIVYLDSIGLG
tara:strand:- start:526 stop:771 length:246 start_codon:yes stop_codon:yes gene_type:complete